MSIPNNRLVVRLTLVGVLVVAYFVLFPQDLASLINPLEQLLKVSQVVSPWLYALIGVVIVCWTLNRIWGKSDKAAVRSEVPPM